MGQGLKEIRDSASQCKGSGDVPGMLGKRGPAWLEQVTCGIGRAEIREVKGSWAYRTLEITERTLAFTLRSGW